MVETGTARARRRDHSIAVTDSSEEEGWLITYLDVITLILVMCVVMLAFSGGQVGPQRWTSDSQAEPVAVFPGTDDLQAGAAEQTLSDNSQPSTAATDTPPPDNPLEAVASGPDLGGLDLDSLGKDIDVILNESSVSFRISSEILFPSGEALLQQGGYDVLDQLIPLLTEVDYRVSIAGHTDDVPIQTLQFPSNWELSSARAGSVVRYLQSQGIDPARLTAIGHGSTQPLADNNSNSGRATNRRVELTLELPAKATSAEAPGQDS